MRAPISVIIPTLNAAGALPVCIASLYSGIEAGLIRELIIVDGGSEDETCVLAAEVGAIVLTARPSRGAQLAAGAAAAEGDWLLFVHADSELSPDWCDAVSAALSNDGAYYFDLRFRANGFAAKVVSGWANLRSRVFGLPYGDQGLLVPRALYDQVGGYPDIPLMEDVAIARALRGRLRPLGATVTTSADKYQRQGWLRRGARNLWTLVRYFMGADPEKLARDYRRDYR